MTVKSNLFLKSYGPMASFHKVIKLLKFNSAANLHCFQWEAQSRERDHMRFRIRMRSLDLPLETMQIFACKKLYNFVKTSHWPKILGIS